MNAEQVYEIYGSCYTLAWSCEDKILGKKTLVSQYLNLQESVTVAQALQ